MKLFVVILFWMLVATEVCGQSRADKLFERGDYLAALKNYSKQLENVDDDELDEKDFLKMRVANCLFYMNNVVRAGELYKTVNPDLLGAEELSNYATTLVHTGDYKKASEQVELAEALGADPMILERIKNTCEFAREAVKSQPMYSATKTKIDFKGLSSGVNYYKGRGLIIAAPNVGENKMKDSRGYATTRLYNAVFIGNGITAKISPFADDLTSKYHIGAVTFTGDYKRIYYTLTILKKDGKSILKLMTAEEIGGKWENIEELSINSDDYSCAHPTLYKDSLLFFVSDMPGGIGGKDIYVTKVKGAECGEISNLGEQINTPEDELFPFVSKEGKIYFSSKGHVGLGGLDVFVSQVNVNGTWDAPQNMGRPINSSMDDFSLVFRNTNCTDGYVSSNRGGTGYNDFLFAIKALPTQKAPRKMLVAYNKQEPEAVTQMQKSMQPGMDQNDKITVDYEYAIQVGAFRNPVPRAYFRTVKDVKVYQGYDNVYRYATGEYPDEQFAKTDLQHVKKEIHDAFVMNVDRYVAEKKIQNNRKGDHISDDELLLRRLKNFEKVGILLNEKKRQLPKPRVLKRPKSGEVQYNRTGFTVVLMSADKVFNPSELSGISNIDVLAISEDEYMYCTGVFSSMSEALMALDKVRSKGFNQAYILDHQGGKKNSQSLTPKTISSRRNLTGLKEILSF